MKEKEITWKDFKIQVLKEFLQCEPAKQERKRIPNPGFKIVT